MSCAAFRPGGSEAQALAPYGPRFPQMEAVKTLAWFELDDGPNVDAATREPLSRMAADWRCTASVIARTEDRCLGPFPKRLVEAPHHRPPLLVVNCLVSCDIQRKLRFLVCRHIRDIGFRQRLAVIGGACAAVGVLLCHPMRS